MKSYGRDSDAVVLPTLQWKKFSLFCWQNIYFFLKKKKFFHTESCSKILVIFIPSDTFLLQLWFAQPDTRADLRFTGKSLFESEILAYPWEMVPEWHG